MGTYDPNPSVSIGGRTWNANVIDGISITAGRTNVDEQPRAGYCTIRLVNYTGITPTIRLNDTVTVNIANSAGIDPSLFSGYVTDVQRRIIGTGPRATVNEVIVTAVGPLARLARLGTQSTYPKAYDGDRIAAILGDAFTTSWDEVASTLTWATAPATKTWNTYDPGYVGSIDTPGDYEVVSYSGGIVSAQSLCDQVAKTGLGVLYETPEGLVNYDSATARIDRAAGGFLTLSADDCIGVGMETSSSIGDLVNRITVTYKNNAETTAEDGDSILRYGLFAAKLSTLLESGTAAAQQRDHYLNTRSLERFNVGAVTVPLHNPDLPDATRDALIGVFCGTPLAIPDFPTTLLPAGFTGFVEGYSWEITKKTALLRMNVSDYGLTAVQQAWLQVNATELWNTISAALEWQDAKVVA